LSTMNPPSAAGPIRTARPGSYTRANRASAGRGPAAFLRRCRPGRVTLDFVLQGGAGTDIRALCGEPGAGPAARYAGMPLNIKRLSAWLNGVLGPRGGGQITSGDLRIYAKTRLIRFGERVISNLTAREFDLFSFLVASSPGISSRQDIISRAWKTVSVENLVDTHIFKLRRKLPPQLAARVRSVPGKGFRYVCGETISTV